MLGYLIVGALAIVGYVVYEHKTATATPQPPTPNQIPSTVAPQAAPNTPAATVQQAAQQAAAQAQSGAAPLLVLPTGQGTGVLDPSIAAAQAAALAQQQQGTVPQLITADDILAAAARAKSQAANDALQGKVPEAEAILTQLEKLPAPNSPEAAAFLAQFPPIAGGVATHGEFGRDTDFGQNHYSNLRGKARGLGSVHAAAQAAAAHAENLARKLGRSV